MVIIKKIDITHPHHPAMVAWWKTTKRYHRGIQVEGPHLTLRDPPFNPNSGFTPGTPVFNHFTSARRRYAPHDVAVKNKNNGYLKKNLYYFSWLLKCCNILSSVNEHTTQSEWKINWNLWLQVAPSNDKYFGIRKPWYTLITLFIGNSIVHFTD